MSIVIDIAVLRDLLEEVRALRAMQAGQRPLLCGRLLPAWGLAYPRCYCDLIAGHSGPCRQITTGGLHALGGAPDVER